MNADIRSALEATFLESIREAYLNNPLKGTPMAGMAVYSAIGETALGLKSYLKGDKDNHGYSDIEIDGMVDEIQEEMRSKFIKF